MKRDQPAGVALGQKQIRQAGGELPGVIVLAQRLPAIAHAAGAIDEQMAAEVGLFFVFLDVKLAGLGVGPPIDVADFVAGVILPMLDEFDAGPFERAFVLADQVAFDNQLGDDFQPAEFRQCRRIVEGRCGHVERIIA